MPIGRAASALPDGHGAADDGHGDHEAQRSETDQDEHENDQGDQQRDGEDRVRLNPLADPNPDAIALRRGSGIREIVRCQDPSGWLSGRCGRDGAGVRPSDDLAARCWARAVRGVWQSCRPAASHAASRDDVIDTLKGLCATR